jgi:exosome complex exonuclease DIS3/RRP44
MIPTLLSTNLCSIHEKVDRLVFSTIWEMTPDAEIVNTRFHKSVINSVGAFTYGQAQERCVKCLPFV